MANQRKLAHEFTVEELDKELIVRGMQKSAGQRFKFKDIEVTPDREMMVAGVKKFYEAAQSLLPNPALGHLSIRELAKALMFKTRTYRVEGSKGVWDLDNRKDFYQIEDEQIKENANCVAAICMKNDLKMSSPLPLIVYMDSLYPKCGSCLALKCRIPLNRRHKCLKMTFIKEYSEMCFSGILST